jgi:hypothetical protein
MVRLAHSRLNVRQALLYQPVIQLVKGAISGVTIMHYAQKYIPVITKWIASI